jgi:hypothetical protein
MRPRPSFVVFVLLVLAMFAAACGDVPIDDQRNDKRLFPARGVIRGTVTYVGPRPCSAQPPAAGRHRHRRGELRRGHR